VALLTGACCRKLIACRSAAELSTPSPAPRGSALTSEQYRLPISSLIVLLIVLATQGGGASGEERGEGIAPAGDGCHNRDFP